MQQRDIKWYGWKPSFGDPRDFYFKVEAPIATPPLIDLREKCPPIYNQGELGSCGEFSTMSAFVFSCKPNNLLWMPSALFLYWNIRFIENTVNYDSGSQLKDVIKSLNQDGICDESLCPYDIENFKDKPSQPAYDAAISNKISLYEKIPDGNLFLMKQCLAKGTPFVFGFTVYESFESDAVATAGIMPEWNASEQVMGGHAVMAVGYNDAKQCVIVRNSWGEDWGDKGYFYMPYSYISNINLASDFWCINAA